MRVFLTGGTGFVGGALARALLADGHAVHAVVRSPARADPLRAAGAILFEGDVASAESLRGAMTGVDAAFHVAGWYKVGDPHRDEAFRVNVTGTRTVLELARALGVPKLVYTSTLAVNSDTHGRVVDETYRFKGRHLSVYDESKAQAHVIAERFIRDGLPLVIVQPGVVYGPGDPSSIGGMFRAFLTRSLPIVPARTAFSWAHVDDVARGHVLAMERGTPGRNYFLAGPACTLVDVMQMAEEITGIRAPRLHPGPTVLRTLAALMAVVERVVRVPDDYTAEALRVVAGSTYLGSGERARTELGWTIRPLRGGLAETLAFERGVLERASDSARKSL